MTTNSLSNQPRTFKESPGTISVGPHSSDTQIVDHFQRGDSTAFNFLYIRYRDRIYGVICSMISNREDALDISQDVFLKAYQALENFKRASQFYSWLYRIAINCCIDHMRRQSKRAWFSDKPISAEVLYHQPVHPAKGLENEEFRRLLHAALPALTPSQRTVFLLRYKEELALKDIACRLGRSIGTVKAHLFHAHRTLRHQLLPYFDFGLYSQRVKT
jgi:RNA polymerase sigma-70 factor (ECF subfamily)